MCWGSHCMKCSLLQGLKWWIRTAVLKRQQGRRLLSTRTNVSTRTPSPPRKNKGGRSRKLVCSMRFSEQARTKRRKQNTKSKTGIKLCACSDKIRITYSQAREVFWENCGSQGHVELSFQIWFRSVLWMDEKNEHAGRETDGMTLHFYYIYANMLKSIKIDITKMSIVLQISTHSSVLCLWMWNFRESVDQSLTTALLQLIKDWT